MSAGRVSAHEQGMDTVWVLLPADCSAHGGSLYSGAVARLAHRRWPGRPPRLAGTALAPGTPYHEVAETERVRSVWLPRLRPTALEAH